MELHPLCLADRNKINSYLKKFPPVISELTFTNLFAWRKSREILWSELADTLFFFTRDQDGLILLGNPIGPAPLSSLINRIDSPLVGIDRFPQSQLKTVDRHQAEISQDRNNADYVYRVDNLALLAGKSFIKKRNHVNKCLKNYNCEYAIISSDNIDQCRRMQIDWCAVRECGINPGLCDEYQAINEVFDHYEQLELIGGAISIDNRVMAFTIGEALNPTTAVCHFEKAMPEIDGLGQLINQWFSKYSLNGFTYVNREQDLGIAGLRKAKESYCPDHLVEKVKISFTTNRRAKENKLIRCAE
ncbi:MAG: phosphatidylglycerol lysyltransferase domain-containing protein [Desulfobulbaceae bacterium]|nr:phosphatidylglycerol lysyltransferase domain-containing protein [Desulfobulbaceae bacterium]HIJ77848.1 DUF2156 domain-containing protein [Deltaproteobacteria bacterium]